MYFLMITHSVIFFINSFTMKYKRKNWNLIEIKSHLWESVNQIVISYLSIVYM